MINIKKIAFVTGSRAEYGIVRHYLKRLNEDPLIDLEIIVTGALLDEKFGKQVDLIYEDGFQVGVEIAVKLDSSSNASVCHIMADLLDQFATWFEQTRYDLVIILGDRYEMLSAAIAVSMQKIPILHIHGGEATYGNYDEFIRHCITKMSRYHFTATEEYRRRVIQLGEWPETVYNLGALGAENCQFIDERNVPEEIRRLDGEKYFVVLFHSETLTDTRTEIQVGELMHALDAFADTQIIFLGTNADTHSEIIRDAVKRYVANHNNTQYFENLHTDAYHYLLKNAICLVGNSSSGLIEAPSLGICTVNIGDRQKGRVRGNSVIDVIWDYKVIQRAIIRVMEGFDMMLMDNPYYQNNALEKYYETTKTILDKIDKQQKPKYFFDLRG